MEEGLSAFGKLIEIFGGENFITALCVAGVGLLILSAFKGGIFGLPKVGTGAAKFLRIIGGVLLLIALLFFLKPNIPPTADDFEISVKKNDTLKNYSMLNRINDQDNDNSELKVSLINDGTIGTGKMEADNISLTYIPNKVGTDQINYKVNDGKGGEATGIITIIVDPPDADIVPRYGKLASIFENRKKGIYKTSIENVKNRFPENKITADDDGLFILNTDRENESCILFMDEKGTAEFYFRDDTNNKAKPKLVEYNPLKPKQEGIKITFCKEYENRTPTGIFTNKNKILFSELEKVEEDGREYGVLHLGLRFHGINSIEERGKLNYQFKRTDGDKIIYDPISITSGSSFYNKAGWRSNLNKKLLPGSYDLVITSKNGTDLGTHSFTIN